MLLAVVRHRNVWKPKLCPCSLFKYRVLEADLTWTGAWDYLYLDACWAPIWEFLPGCQSMGYIFQPDSTVTETFPIALSVMVGIKLRKHGGKTECIGEEGGNLGCGRGKVCPAGGTCQRQFAFSNDFGWQRTIKLHIMGKAQCLHSSWPVRKNFLNKLICSSSLSRGIIIHYCLPPKASLG